MTEPKLLSTLDMARFVADGYLRLDAVVPDEINQGVMAELRERLGKPSHEPSPFQPRSGTPLRDCYPADSAIRRVYEVPEIAGAILSLVGSNPLFDHHAIHFLPRGSDYIQDLHCDAAIDSGDPPFDIQLFYFPHDVAEGAGGTRFVPGSHIRNIHENSVARYQHIAGEQYFTGPAGTVLIFHQGVWHAGQPNPSDDHRWMFKLRLNPTEPQVRLWDTSDYDDAVSGSWDHMFATTAEGDTVANHLRKMQAWSFDGEYRLETMERVRLWRYLSGDEHFDVDWYRTRIEGRSALIDRDGVVG
ncbi:MAG: phytanoyl-CoA dioxygenase family protein [Acidimicrobiales bacterium]